MRSSVRYAMLLVFFAFMVVSLRADFHVDMKETPVTGICCPDPAMSRWSTKWSAPRSPNQASDTCSRYQFEVYCDLVEAPWMYELPDGRDYEAIMSVVTIADRTPIWRQQLQLKDVNNPFKHRMKLQGMCHHKWGAYISGYFSNFTGVDCQVCRIGNPRDCLTLNDDFTPRTQFNPEDKTVASIPTYGFPYYDYPCILRSPFIYYPI